VTAVGSLIIEAVTVLGGILPREPGAVVGRQRGVVGECGWLGLSPTTTATRPRTHRGCQGKQDSDDQLPKA